MAEVRLRKITKKFNNHIAVAEMDLDIRDGEFLVLVGPSGCGKTTTLRMIAGLEEPSDGEIYIGQDNVTFLEPKQRNIAMVFQNYALYPHMTVYENMAYGLRLRKVSNREIEERIQEAAEMLGVKELLTRYPRQLSGGQQQRVALGRAIVRTPKVFLMDEPLSNLDAKLRVQTRAEIIKLHRQLKTTVVYVTHDQVEAMTMGTRIVVMKDGFVQQVGTPKEIYQQPQNIFVGGFVGAPPMQFLNGTVILDRESVIVNGSNFKLSLPASETVRILVGKNIILGLRPENLAVIDETAEESSIPCQVEVIENIGAEILLHTRTLGNEQLIIRLSCADTDLEVGALIKVQPVRGNIHFFDAETGQALHTHKLGDR